MSNFSKTLQNNWILIIGLIAILIVFFHADESYSSSISSFVSMIWNKFEYSINDEAELTIITTNFTKQELFANVTSLASPHGVSMKLIETEKNSGIFKGKIRFVKNVIDETGEIKVLSGGDTVIVEYAGTKTKVTIMGPPTQAFTLTISSKIIGGELDVNDFPLMVNGNQIQSGKSKTYNSNSTMTIGEKYQPNYKTEITGMGCPENLDEPFKLTQDTVCTVTNTLVSPVFVTVIKKVINDDGGKKMTSDFTMIINAANPSQSRFSGSERGQTITIDPGDYSVTESGPSQYITTFSPECSGNAAAGEEITCIITSNDISGPLSLTVIKEVQNSPLNSDDLVLLVNGTQVLSNMTNTYPANSTIDLGESSHFQYKFTSITGDNCPAKLGEQFTLKQDTVCTVISTYIPSLTVIKNLVGGQAAPDDFSLKVNGNPVLSGGVNYYPLNSTLTLGEISLSGYDFTSITGDNCPAKLGEQFTLKQDTVCTITSTIVSELNPVLVILSIIVPLGGGMAFVMHNHYGGKTKRNSKYLASKPLASKHLAAKPRNIDVDIDVNVELE